MRIAIVAQPYVPIPPNQYGGIEQVIYYLIKGLKEAGHQPVLFGPGDSTVDCELIPTVSKSISFAKSRSDVAAQQRRVERIHRHTERLLRIYSPRLDIIHSHGFDLQHFKGTPNLTTLHNKIDLDDIDYFLARRNLNYVSISDNQQEVCPDLNYMRTVYNGEDPDQFPYVDKPEDYVCFLGRFDRDKSPHLAIQLALRLGIKIKLGGKIDFLAEGYFDEEIAKYLDHPLVEYLGELDFKQKTELLSKALCNLHPTGFREPFGLTVVEAAYCGTPTLAIARGAMPELIESGRTGVLVEDFVEGYHKLIECFSMDRNYIATRARQLFNYKKMTEQYIQAYQRAINAFNNHQEHQEAIRSMIKGSTGAIKL